MAAKAQVRSHSTTNFAWYACVAHALPCLLGSNKEHLCSEMVFGAALCAASLLNYYLHNRRSRKNTLARVRQRRCPRRRRRRRCSFICASVTFKSFLCCCPSARLGSRCRRQSTLCRYRAAAPHKCMGHGNGENGREESHLKRGQSEMRDEIGMHTHTDTHPYRDQMHKTVPFISMQSVDCVECGLKRKRMV